MRFEQPSGYASLTEMQRALLVQTRRFRKLCVAAGDTFKPMVLNPVVRKAPNPNAIAPNSDVETLDALMAQAIMLRNMSSQLITTFADRPQAKSADRAIQTLLTQVQGRADELRRRLGKAATKQVSRSLKITLHSLMDLLADDFKGLHTNIAENFMLADVKLPNSASVVPAEIAYAVIKDLKDADGYRHPEYFIIIAHPLGEASRLPAFLVATTTEFKVPSRIRWDATARNNNELKKVVKDLIAQEGIIGRAFTRNIPVPQNRIKFVHNNVKSTQVTGDVITVRVRDVKLIEPTRDAIRAQLNAIVRAADPRNRDVVRDKIVKDRGIIQFVFSLPGRLRGRLVNKEVMQKLQSLLKLSDDEIVRIRTALEDAE